MPASQCWPCDLPLSAINNGTIKLVLTCIMQPLVLHHNSTALCLPASIQAKKNLALADYALLGLHPDRGYISQRLIMQAHWSPKPANYPRNCRPAKKARKGSGKAASQPSLAPAPVAPKVKASPASKQPKPPKSGKASTSVEQTAICCAREVALHVLCLLVSACFCWLCLEAAL